MTEYVVLIVGDAERWWTTMSLQERARRRTPSTAASATSWTKRGHTDHRRCRAARQHRGAIDPGRRWRRHRGPVRRDRRAGRRLLPGRDRRPRRPARVLPDHRDARVTGSRSGGRGSGRRPRATREALRAAARLRAGRLGDAASEEVQQELFDAHHAPSRTYVDERGRRLGSAALADADTATTVRHADGAPRSRTGRTSRRSSSSAATTTWSCPTSTRRSRRRGCSRRRTPWRSGRP